MRHEEQRLNDKKIRFRWSPLMIRAVHISHREMERKRLTDKESEGATGSADEGDDK